MSKLDDTMERFDKACEDEAKADTALAEAETALVKLQEDSATLTERIEGADRDLATAKITMEGCAITLRGQVDNEAYCRGLHHRKEAWDAYIKAREAVSAANLAQNALHGSAETLVSDTRAREKVIEEAKLTVKRARSHKLQVAEELRPLIASEVAGYTGKAMSRADDAKAV
jgi:hypothetical protein